RRPPARAQGALPPKRRRSRRSRPLGRGRRRSPRHARRKWAASAETGSKEGPLMRASVEIGRPEPPRHRRSARQAARIREDAGQYVLDSAASEVADRSARRASTPRLTLLRGTNAPARPHPPRLRDNAVRIVDRDPTPEDTFDGDRTAEEWCE